MLSIRKALAILRQLRIGRTVECGWIADGSAHESKCAIGVCIGVQASRTGIVLRIAGLHAKTRQPVMQDRLIRRINWKLSADVVRLILGAMFAQDRLPSGRMLSTPVSIGDTNRTIRQVRQGYPVRFSPEYSLVSIPGV